MVRIIFSFSRLITVLGLFLLCVLGSWSLVDAESVESLTIDRYVHDAAQVIEDSQEHTLNQTLAQFAHDHGHQLLVVTVNNLDGDYIEHYSIKLAEKVQAGDAKHDNGAILLLSKDDRAVRIEVGYGLERTLTDGVSNRIIQSMIPLLKDGNYSQAIGQAMTTMMQVTSAEVLTGSQTSPAWGGFARDPIVWFVMFYILYIVLVRLASILGRTKSRRLGGVIGGVIGVIVIVVGGFRLINIFLSALITLFGLIFDYIVSQDYRQYLVSQGRQEPHRRSGGQRGPGGGFDGFSGGGGFGGFGGGGGGFGGGGASGKR